MVRKVAVSSRIRVRPRYLNVLVCGIQRSIRVCYDYIMYVEIFFNNYIVKSKCYAKGKALSR